MGLKSSLRLDSRIQLPESDKERSCLHSCNDAALAQLCKWECEVGMAELFLFDVAKKCDELHKIRKLGKPHYKHKFSRSD